MEKSKITEVDEYIIKAKDSARPLLEKLREIIMQTVPDAEEGISYGVPFYKYYGQLVGFAEYANHVSFGFGEEDLISKEERKSLEDKGYKLGKSIIQIQYGQEIPVDIIKRSTEDKAIRNEVRKKK